MQDGFKIMKEKIIILTYSLGGAGAERIAANLLNNLDRNKYEIILVLMNTDIEYDILPNQTIHFIEKSYRYEKEWRKFIKLPFLGRRFAKYSNKENVKLVLAIMNRPNLVACFAKVFGIKARVLISERCYTPYTYNKQSLAGKIKVALLKWAYPKADAILPNSKGTVEALQQYYNIHSDFTVVKNPTDIQRIKNSMDAPVEGLFGTGKFTFINVATFRHEKNQEMLIDAVAGLHNFDFQLILIGKGPTLEPLQQKVKTLGLRNKIIFVNFTDNPYRYMAKSDCFLLSSFSEGFPNVLIESLVCALPMISVDCKTGPRELLAPATDLNTTIKDGDFEIATYGILTAPGSLASMQEAMQWALQNSDKLKAYKPLLPTVAQAYEMQKVCTDFSAIFDKYLNQNKA